MDTCEILRSPQTVISQLAMSKVVRKRTRARSHPYLGAGVDWKSLLPEARNPYTPLKISPELAKKMKERDQATVDEYNKKRAKGGVRTFGITPEDTAYTNAQHRLKNNQYGDGVWDSVKSFGKKAIKYVAPVAVGLAGAAAAHYLTKKKPVDKGDSRYTDDSLPFADSNESSYRERPPREVAPRLTPDAIKLLYVIRGLHATFNPADNHPWVQGGSLIGPTTLAALAAGHKSSDDPKIRHLIECSHCRGKGIGKKLWNGIKGVGKEVYGAVKPWVVPVALAAGAAAAGHYALNRSKIIPNTINAISKAGSKSLAVINPGYETRLAEYAAAPAAVEYERSGRYNNPFDRPVAQKGYWD